MPRFVILEHDHPELHWDFMLENGDVLRTWRLAQVPHRAGERIRATAIGDHRPAYLDYEGEVSGGRGRVIRWDGGTYTDLTAQGERVQVRLQGEKLRGTVVLKRIGGEEWRWVFGEVESAGATKNAIG